jgi:hypothetical protein
MKKLTILILLILFNLISFGQISKITPKIGLTLSNLRDLTDMDYKLGYLFGTSIDYNLSQRFVLKPEIRVEQKGSKRKGFLTDEYGNLLPDSKGYLTYNYLSLPLLIEYHPFKRDNAFFNMGPYIGYLLSTTERTKSTYDGEFHDSKRKLDISKYNHWDVGFGIGGGINFPFLKRGQIKIDLLYEYAISIASKEMPPRTNTFSLSAGYSILLIK